MSVRVEADFLKEVDIGKQAPQGNRRLGEDAGWWSPFYGNVGNAIQL